jgi:hypothetical protein
MQRVLRLTIYRSLGLYIRLHEKQSTKSSDHYLHMLVLAACVITGSRGAMYILLVTVLACVWVKTKTEKTTGKLSIATKTILTISIARFYQYSFIN